MSEKLFTDKKLQFGSYQAQFQQFGDDPVKHPSVVLLVDLVGDLLHDVLGCQRRAVNLTEVFWLVCSGF